MADFVRLLKEAGIGEWKQDAQAVALAKQGDLIQPAPAQGFADLSICFPGPGGGELRCRISIYPDGNIDAQGCLGGMKEGSFKKIEAFIREEIKKLPRRSD